MMTSTKLSTVLGRRDAADMVLLSDLASRNLPIVLFAYFNTYNSYCAQYDLRMYDILA